MALIVLRKVGLLLRTKPVRPKFYSCEPEYEYATNTGKVVNVAIIGAPNSGKSTLINNIVDRKICAASNKVHTTTKLARAIHFENDTQIVFLDTPGIVTEKEKKKYKLPESMLTACHKSLQCANVVGVIHDVSNKYTKESLHPDVISILNLVEDIPSFLVLNKVDKLKTKKHLLSTIWHLTNGYIAGNPIPGPKDRNKRHESKGYSKFSDVFMVSALKGDGVIDIKQYLLSNAKPSKYQYSPIIWTDQKPEDLIVEAVRATFLDFLPQEIPYRLKTELEYYHINVEEDRVVCCVVVECASERLARLIGGAGGGRLQQMKSHARENLMNMFQKPVTIDIRLTHKDAKS